MHLRRVLHGLAAGSLAFLLSGPSHASGLGERQTGRYTVTPVEGGFLRTDTDTGAVSHCAKKDGGWACSTVPDDYQAMQRRVDELARENAELRKRLAEADASRSGLPGAGGSDRKLELPSEEDIDKALGYFDRLIRKFKDFVDKQRSTEGSGRQL